MTSTKHPDETEEQRAARQAAHAERQAESARLKSEAKAERIAAHMAQHPHYKLPTADDYLAAVRLTCPDGHFTGTQAKGGTQVRCGACSQAGKNTVLTVPLRPGEQPVPPPSCRRCGGQARGPRPEGWLLLSVTASTAKNGNKRQQFSLYCSTACVMAALQRMGTSGVVRRDPVAVAARRRQTENMMTAVPRGRREGELTRRADAPCAS